MVLCLSYIVQYSGKFFMSWQQTRIFRLFVPLLLNFPLSLSCGGRRNGAEGEIDTSGEMSVVFRVERSEGGGRRESGEGWGLVGGLEEGTEYEFSVAAEVVIDDGSEKLEGAKTESVTGTVVDTSGE